MGMGALTPGHLRQKETSCMDKPLAGKQIAILAANGFEEAEFVAVQKELLGLGASLRIISNIQGLVNGWSGSGWGMNFPVDLQLTEAMAADFDGCFVPSGERSVGKLAQTAHTKRLLNHFIEAGKPVLAVGEGAALLGLTRCIAGRVISVPAVHADALAQAGAVISEEAVTIDGALMTVITGAALLSSLDSVTSVFTEASELLAAA
jgi:protease I